jgi:hypothetical protein
MLSEMQTPSLGREALVPSIWGVSSETTKCTQLLAAACSLASHHSRLLEFPESSTWCTGLWFVSWWQPVLGHIRWEAWSAFCARTQAELKGTPSATFAGNCFCLSS